MDKINIEIYSIVGNPLCVAAEDGEKVYLRIKEALKKKKKVVLFFKNVKMLKSAFLNVAIGKLYKDFNEILIKSSLSVKEMTDEDKVLLKRVTTRAKAFYKDPDKLKKSIEEVMEG